MDIKELRGKLEDKCAGVAPLDCVTVRSRDLRAMLADHARLQADVLSMQEFIGPSLLSYWATTKKEDQS